LRRQSSDGEEKKSAKFLVRALWQRKGGRGERKSEVVRGSRSWAREKISPDATRATGAAKQGARERADEKQGAL
jgi:hypothetical protein